VALSGTLSPDGPHLHIAVADAAGRTLGGHLGVGSIVHTTAEIVVVELRGVDFSRQPDRETGTVSSRSHVRPRPQRRLTASLRHN
jgi:predicted DNA-binding protein with PD1-like motif